LFILKRKFLFAAVLVLAGLLSFFLRPNYTFSRQGMAMNTFIRMSIKAHNDYSLNDAFTLLNSLDFSLSMYNPSSDISRINSLAGIHPVHVPDYALNVIRKAAEIHDLTQGTFNPLIGSLTKLWKINRNDGFIPSQESIDIAVNFTDINNLVILDNSVYLKHKECVLDLGGIAKGFAGDLIAQLFRSNGITSALIDLGGNICVIGKNFDGYNWKIGIRDPFEPLSNPALVILTHDNNIITSGNYERFKLADGKKFSHFFDPKTGNSIMNDLLSVTVIHHNGALADGLATAFMAMGFNKARDFAQLLNVNTILIRNDKSIHASQNLKNSVSANKFHIEFF